MKLLLDQGLPRSAADLLRAQGHDAVHTAEIGLSMATDLAIIARASDEGRVIVTLDADFHTVLALAGAARPSVIRIRLQRLKAADHADVITRVIAACEADLLAGAAVSVAAARIRVRRLPLS
jgi:predicted nuclease of predicted toxin-antitoxin system